jgi:hypothetical protein
MECLEMVSAMQQHDKHVSVAIDTDTRKQDMVFSMQSSPRLYNEDQQQGSKCDCAGEA